MVLDCKSATIGGLAQSLTKVDKATRRRKILHVRQDEAALKYRLLCEGRGDASHPVLAGGKAGQGGNVGSGSFLNVVQGTHHGLSKITSALHRRGSIVHIVVMSGHSGQTRL